MMSDSEPRSFRVGDTLPEGLANKADCPEQGPKLTFQALCVFDRGHDGPHVAINATDRIVEVWH
ncbi:hypothetical protein [Pseudarthrobacter sp. NPDC057230]|uniref:hypothetical protein n=1 Tax=Pseudarthrobacter sp. NPDC057230 TaxID=3346057 RepID=UPI0036270484